MNTQSSADQSSNDSRLVERLRGTLPDFAWVALGGGLGSVARWLVAHLVLVVVPTSQSTYLGTFAVNICGAFALGWLLTALELRGSANGRWRRTRLLCGTGFLGGFTTYSLFAVDSIGTLDSPFRVLWYCLGTLVLGALASWLGIVLGRCTGPRGAGQSTRLVNE